MIIQNTRLRNLSITTFAPLIVTDGLVLNLDAKNYSGSGTTWPSSAGYTAATLYNSPTWHRDYFTFNQASKQWADVPYIGDLTGWTVEAWFNAATGMLAMGNGAYGLPAVVSTVYNYGDAGGDFPGVINYTLTSYDGAGDNTANMNCGFYNGSGWHTVAGATVVQNTWYHVAGTYDGNNSLKIYVNGSFVAEQYAAGGSSANNGRVRIARRWDADLVNGTYDTTKNFFDGNIGIVRVYYRPLNALEVKQNFDANRSRFGL